MGPPDDNPDPSETTPGPAGRLPLVPEDPDDPVLREIFDFYRARGRPISVLYRTLGNAPAVLRGWSSLGWSLRHEAALDRGLRELVIMRVSQLARSEFEWQAHWPMALEAGVAEEQLRSLARWQTSDAFSDTERAVLAFADQATASGNVDDPTFAAVGDRLSPGELVELAVITAFYSCVAQVVQTLRIPRLAPGGLGLDVFREAVR